MITKKSQEASASNFDHNRENSKICRSHIYWVKDDNSIEEKYSFEFSLKIRHTETVVAYMIMQGISIIIPL